MKKRNLFLTINPEQKVFSSIQKLKNSGTRCLVVEDKNILLGTLSDGDIRKVFKKINKNTLVRSIYNKNPHFLNLENVKKKNLDRLFKIKNLDLVPICNKNKEIKKIITKIDYLKSPEKFLINQKTPVLIMSGGEGKRLNPITEIIPKQLIPINGKSVIENIIDTFRTNNFFGKIIISTNYFADLITAYLKKKKLKSILFLKEKKKLGTIGALSLIKFQFKNIIVTNCDVIFNLDPNKFLKFHINNKNDISILITNKSFTVPYGVCRINNSLLEKIEEKPKLNYYLNTGMYIINKKSSLLLKKNKKMDFDRFIKLAKLKNYRIGVFKISKKDWLDIGVYSELEKTIKFFSKS